MSQSQASDKKEMNKIGAIEAYDILMQRTIDENRLLTERTTIFLAASSILVLAFVMLSNPNLAPVFKALRIALPILGIFLTFLFYSFSRASINALEFYWRAQENIERTAPEFAYMQENRIAPQKDGWDFIEGKRVWKQNDSIWAPKITGKLERYRRKPFLFAHISNRCLPLAFGILWITLLILARLG